MRATPSDSSGPVADLPVGRRVGRRVRDDLRSRGSGHHDTVGARVDSRTSAFGVLSGHGRILLLVVLGLTLIADVALYIAGDASSWRTLLISVVFTFVIALFAWWPVVAATGLLLVALVEASSGQIGGHVLYLPAVVGMVVYVSPRWFAGLYGLAIVGIAGVASSTSESLTTAAVPALFLLGALSALIGWGFRSARVRERHLVLDVERLVHERAVELRGERERIADELHDIIAHDVTLVAMHVRVLDRVQDPGLRRTSQRAIRESADRRSPTSGASCALFVTCERRRRSPPRVPMRTCGAPWRRPKLT